MWHRISTVAETFHVDPEIADAFARKHHERFHVINDDGPHPMVNTFYHDAFLKAVREETGIAVQSVVV